MSYVPQKTFVQEKFTGTVCVCYHCGERFGTPNGTCASLCRLCKSAEGRGQVHAGNVEVDPNWKCRVCEYVEGEKAKRKVLEA